MKLLWCLSVSAGSLYRCPAPKQSLPDTQVPAYQCLQSHPIAAASSQLSDSLGFSLKPKPRAPKVRIFNKAENHSILPLLMHSVCSYSFCLLSPASYSLHSGHPCSRATTLLPQKGPWESENKKETQLWFKERFCLSVYGLSDVSRLLTSKAGCCYLSKVSPPGQKHFPSLPDSEVAKLRLMIPCFQLEVLLPLSPSFSLSLYSSSTQAVFEVTTASYASKILTCTKLMICLMQA